MLKVDTLFNGWKTEIGREKWGRSPETFTMFSEKKNAGANDDTYRIRS